jgi:TonB-linked SusC/RagA family outer membrane protein
MASVKENYNKKMNFRLSTYLEATIINGLTFKTELSADYNLNKYYYYMPDYQFGVLTNDIRTSTWTKTDTKYWSWRNILTYNKVIAKKHNINAMVGQEMSDNHYETQKSAATGFLSNAAHDPSAGDITTSSGTGSQNESSILSYFGRVFYSYDDRYLLTATLRRDGSSKFAKGNRWGWFPSAALAWKLKNEAFLKDNKVINNFKLRLGWGATGNQNVEDWAYTSLLSTKTTPWGTTVLTGNTANPELKWETTYSTNFGIDLNLFDNRIEFIADIYYKKTKDLLLQIELPSFLGSGGQGAASNPWANVGSLENKGVELTLNTVNIDKGGFQWRSNVVFSLNRNKVVSLGTSAAIPKTLSVGDDNSTVTRTEVGQPIGQFWGYKVIGRFDKAEDFYYKDADGNVKAVAIPEGSSIEESKTWIGDYIFADLNGDGVINNSDCTYIGNPEAKFTFGFGNTFSWKGFDLTIFLSGSYGNDVRNLYVSNASSTHLPRISASTTNGNNRVSDLYVEDGSYVRIQNVSLAYNIPKKYISKLNLQSARIYANLQNLYTWTKYDGFDPEIGCYSGDALRNGIDYGRYPSPRMYTFGLNVSF